MSKAEQDAIKMQLFLIITIINLLLLFSYFILQGFKHFCLLCLNHHILGLTIRFLPSSVYIIAFYKIISADVRFTRLLHDSLYRDAISVIRLTDISWLYSSFCYCSNFRTLTALYNFISDNSNCQKFSFLSTCHFIITLNFY